MTTAERVLVRYFAAAAEAAGTEEETLEVPAEATLAWLRGRLIEGYGDAMTTAIRNGSFLIDGVAETDDDVRLGTSVDVLPPFTGG
jgi:molybdopterin synthase sulfur carrier subunit